jgi:hypothetical protein
MNIVDQEEIAPPKETTMLIWDPDLDMTSDEPFEVQEPPTKVLVVKTRSMNQHVSRILTMTQISGGRPAPDHLK